MGWDWSGVKFDQISSIIPYSFYYKLWRWLMLFSTEELIASCRTRTWIRGRIYLRITFHLIAACRDSKITRATLIDKKGSTFLWFNFRTAVHFLMIAICLEFSREREREIYCDNNDNECKFITRALMFNHLLYWLNMNARHTTNFH